MHGFLLSSFNLFVELSELVKYCCCPHLIAKTILINIDIVVVVMFSWYMFNFFKGSA